MSDQVTCGRAEGRSSVDESGKPVPVKMVAGNRVPGATINERGSLAVEAERVGKDAVLAQFVEVVANVQHPRAALQKLVGSVAGYFVPAVSAVAVLVFTGWAI